MLELKRPRSFLLFVFISLCLFLLDELNLFVFDTVDFNLLDCVGVVILFLPFLIVVKRLKHNTLCLLNINNT